MEKKKYNNDVIFIGTWMPERGVFFKKLIDMGLNLRIFGGRWEKDKHYQLLRKRITLGHVDDPLYSKLIQCAKIALCIPSESNLDDVTQRSSEIPAIGTLLCATRTKTHKKMFIENKEAVFFKDERECFKKCTTLLSNTKRIKKISKRGHIKITKILKANEQVMLRQFIKKIF